MTKKPNNTKSTTRDVNAAVRVTQAIKLRAQKMTYSEIATQCGYADRAACYRAVQRELQRVVVTNVEELRREELVALDIIQSECMQLFLDKDNKGRLFAADRVLVAMERRAKLMGLDAKPDALPDGTTIIREYGVEVIKV